MVAAVHTVVAVHSIVCCTVAAYSGYYIVAVVQIHDSSAEYTQRQYAAVSAMIVDNGAHRPGDSTTQ
jgi:hypothetical protein